MSETSDILTGIAQLLHDAGVGRWSPNAAVSEAEVAIACLALPQSPTRVISLTDYVVQDDPLLSDAITGVQVRIRGDDNPLTASEIRDGVFAALQGLRNLTFGATPVSLIWRQSAAALGPDSLHRFERSENYYVRHAHPIDRLE